MVFSDSLRTTLTRYGVSSEKDIVPLGLCFSHLFQHEPQSVATQRIVKETADALVEGIQANLEAAGVVESLRAATNATTSYLNTLGLTTASSSSIANTAASVYVAVDLQLRETLFQVLVDEGEYSEAASALCRANFNLACNGDYAKILDLYLKCAEAYMMDNASPEAEAMLSRSMVCISHLDTKGETGDATVSFLLLRHRVIHARILDSNRKFIEAAARYYEVSTLQNENFIEEELLQLLGNAVTCTVLSKASIARSRMLTTLFQDRRLRSLDHLEGFGTHSVILEKMFHQQLIRRQELKPFEATLAPHQKAKMPDGLTVLERAVVEHNILASMRIYDNLYLSQLADLLLLDELQAEKIVSAMICEGRLLATIDQAYGLLIFQPPIDPVLRFEDTVADLCKEVVQLTEVLKSPQPVNQ